MQILRKKLQKQKNTNQLTEKVTLFQSKDFVIITFPKAFKPYAIKGSVQFYCPSKTNKDLLFKIEPDTNNIQKFGITNFSEKRYQVKVDWTSDSISYYQEFNINL